MTPLSDLLLYLLDPESEQAAWQRLGLWMVGERETKDDDEPDEPIRDLVAVPADRSG